MKLIRRKHIVGFPAALAAGACFAALISATPAHANPQGGVVVSGAATFSDNGSKLDIHQTTNRALIDWRSFDIAAGEHTQFHQPSANAVAVNRISDINPSTIAGTLSANGNLVLINPNGMMFTSTAVVDVNGIVATTADIDTAAFEAGSMFFDKTGNRDAKIINNGLITAADAGLVGLVAPQVENHGIIQARYGRIQLASADVATLDFYGDGLLKVAVKDSALEKQFVHNTGALEAEGGTVAMTAATARNVFDSLIQVEGELKAPVVEQSAGKIVIRNANDGIESDSTVLVQAELDASGRDVGEQGGSIEILGGNIGLFNGTTLDASGHSAPVAPEANTEGTATVDAEGNVRTEAEFLAHQNRAGGSIKVGGDYLGSGDTQTAQNLFVDEYVITVNDALESGDAGRTVFWSDNATTFKGYVFGRGGTEAGNGGFVETSGKNMLDVHGYVDLRNRAEGYNKGTYLLDPSNIAVYGNVDGQFTSTDGAVDLTDGQVLHLDLNVPAPSVTDQYLGTAASQGAFNGFSVIDDTAVNRSGDAIFSVDIVIPASPTGVIYEQGGSGFGTYIGFQADGTLVFHAGRGSSFTANDAAHLELAPGTLTGSGTLAWDINLGSNTISAYWNGNLVGSNTAASNFTSWSGGDDGGFGQVTNSIVVGANTASFNGTFNSTLKYYAGASAGFLSDASGSGNGANVTAGSPSVQTGIFNGQDAVVMNNADQFEIADTNDINLINQSGIGRSFTFRTDADVNTQQVLYKEGGGTNGYVVYLENGVLKVGLYNSTNRQWRQFGVTGNTDYQLSSTFDAANNRFVVSLNGIEDDGLGLGAGTDFAAHSGDITFGRADTSIRDENSASFTPTNTISTLGEAMFHNIAMDDNTRHIVDQYSATKFGISLNGLGTGANEVERATAADGYSVFTADYLEHLSSMADVTLVADNNITLDLQDDTLTMDTGRNLTFTATNGQISELSGGAIVTNNGDISLNAGNNITLTQTSLQAGGTGKVNVNAGGNVQLQQAEALSLGTVNANNFFARTTGENSDITLNGVLTATGSGNAMTLVAGRDLVNNYGNNALRATNGRWLGYTDEADEDNENGLKPKFRKFGAPYASNLPASITDLGNGLIYVSTEVPSFLQPKALPDTVAQISQVPTLQRPAVRAPRATLEGEIFEVSEPLRLQLESDIIEERASSYSGTIRLDPMLAQEFDL
tara:strand:- start:100832 stop:104425 length:3594 start_codon:yes stop_codon:yes gene_type:complete